MAVGVILQTQKVEAQVDGLGSCGWVVCVTGLIGCCGKVLYVVLTRGP